MSSSSEEKESKPNFAFPLEVNDLKIIGDNGEEVSPHILAKLKIVMDKMLQGKGTRFIAEYLGVGERRAEQYIAMLGKHMKTQLTDLDQLVAESETNYYRRKEQLEEQIDKIMDLLKDAPGDPKLLKSFSVLQYTINRITQDRIINLRTLKVVPMKGEVKFVHHSGGYRRVDYKVDAIETERINER